MLNLAYCFDNNYRQHFAAAICSTIENYKSEIPLTINIVTHHLDDDFVKKISALNNKNNISIEWFDIEQITQGLPVPNGMHFSEAIYLRLYLPEILGANVKKVLYLDSDTICLHDITALLQTEMGNHYVAGVLDPQNSVESKRVNVKHYINSGVLLMNLDRWRSEKISEKCIKWIESQSAICLGDQDAINVICENKIKILDVQWNTTINLEKECAISRAKIIHYISGNKPWQSWYDANLAKPYHYYLNLTAWKNTPLVPPKTINQATLVARRIAFEGNQDKAIEIYETIINELSNHVNLLINKQYSANQSLSLTTPQKLIASNESEMVDLSDKISGFYINLDKSTERRVSFEQQLNQLEINWPILRFPAQSGDDRPSKIKGGELGCFLSHQAIINMHNSDTFLAIFEDDVIILPEFKKIIPEIIKNIDENIDIIFIGSGIDYANINMMSELIKLKNKHISNSKEKESVNILNAQDWYNHGAHAYIITKTGIPKIREIINNSSKLGYPTPIDDLYRTSIKNNQITGAVIFPFLVELAMEFETTISSRAEVPAAAGYELLYSAAANLFTCNLNQKNLLNWVNSDLNEKEFDINSFIASQIVYKRFVMDISKKHNRI